MATYSHAYRFSLGIYTTNGRAVCAYPVSIILECAIKKYAVKIFKLENELKVGEDETAIAFRIKKVDL